jgi:uncharacterized repeat protein (TIGR02543 family)
MRLPFLPARLLAVLAILGGTLAVGAPQAGAADEACTHTSPRLTGFALGGQQPSFYYKAEGGVASFRIHPGGETCAGETLKVNYDTPPIAPTTTADYTRQTGFVEWEFAVNHGAEPTQPVAVSTTDDSGTTEAAAEAINAKLTSSTVTLANGNSHTGGFGSPQEAPIYIVDADGPTEVRFVGSNQSVLENAGSVRIPIFRAGTDTSGNVGYQLVAGSANPATDLSGEPASGNFTFAPDLRLGTLDLTLNNDSLCEGPETLTAQFPGGTATDGPGSVTLTITDDDSGCAGTHNLTVAKSGTGGGTVTSSPAGIACGLDCSENYPEGQGVTLTASPASGSVFDHWSGDCTGTATTCNVTMNTAKNVTAWFTSSVTTHTLSVTVNGTGSGTVTSSPAGINCPGDCSQSYDDGQVVTLTAAPGGGSTFAGWSGACTGTATTCNVTMNAARSVTATFNASGGGPFTLTVTRNGRGGSVTSSPAGITCPSDCSQSYASGTEVTLTATANDGWTFAGWSGACTGTGTTCTVTMDSAKAVTATFAIGTAFPLNVTVNGTGSGTVTSSPSGVACPGDCSQSYASGQAVTLTAAPGGGSTFAGWSGDCTGTGTTCNLTMNAARNVTATFNTTGGGTFNLTVTRFGQGAAEGTVTSTPSGISCGTNCSEAYPAGQAVTLTATASPGWNFDHWAGDCSGTSSTCNLTMGADKSVAAWFEDKTAPTSDFHHPNQGTTYDYDVDSSGFKIREVHVFTHDAGVGVGSADGGQVRIALRKRKTNGTCEWWNGSGFTAGPCAAKVWHQMTEYDFEAHFYLYNFPELPSSVGTAIRNYTAYCLATDSAGNAETAFVAGRNNNTFEVAPNSP